MVRRTPTGRCRPAVLLLCLCSLVAACGDSSPSQSSAAGKLRVVASFYPVAEAATRVGGDAVEVVNLTPAGTEPHDLELSSRQVDQLQDADVVIYLGGGFQPAIEKVAERRRKPSVDLADALPLEEGAAGDLHAEEGRDERSAAPEVDPHFWLDPVLMSSAVDEVERVLGAARPRDRAVFAKEAEGYRAELRGLDGELRAGLANCDRRQLVTSHAAFHYLAKRYGLTQEAIAGLSPEAEPDPKRLAQLADTVRAKGVTTVFYETLASPRVADALAREASVRTAVLNPVEGLTDEQVRQGQTYAGVMRQNLGALRQALGCR